MEKFESHSLDDTKKIAFDWLKKISQEKKDNKKATLVGLSGHLGSGKTAFIKFVAKALNISEEITSPTFVIMKIYESSDFNWSRLIHIDSYRLERREELSKIDFDDLMKDPRNLILMEWPENVGMKQFDPMCHLTFEIVGGAHTIKVE